MSPSRLRERRERDEAGMTLVELLVAMVLLSIVSVAFYSGLTSMMNNTSRQSALVANQESVRFAMLEMTRDIRGANPILTLTDVNAYQNEIDTAVLPAVGDTPVYVRWKLTGTTLTWNGSTGSTVTFDMPSGSSAGDTYYLTLVAEIDLSALAEVATAAIHR